jgi:hypothetical protein
LKARQNLENGATEKSAASQVIKKFKDRKFWSA